MSNILGSERVVNFGEEWELPGISYATNNSKLKVGLTIWVDWHVNKQVYINASINIDLIK